MNPCRSREYLTLEWSCHFCTFYFELGTVHKCRLCVPLPTIRAKRVDCVSICRWGVRQTGRILTEFRVQLQTLLPSVLVSRQRPQHFTSPRRKSTFWAKTACPPPNQTVELQSFSTASIIRDNFRFRGSSYTKAKATRSGSS